jgi:hypothetical protein
LKEGGSNNEDETSLPATTAVGVDGRSVNGY